MTTDLVQHTPAAGALTERMEFARALSAANLLPRAFQGNPANVLLAIEYGDALGIRPVVAMSEINVINGTPSLSAALMASLARQAGHRVRVTGDANAATCVIVRADDPEFEHSATWDVTKAKAFELWGRGHWKKDPATMLKWRAIAECVRFACPEVLAGIRYTPEEVAEFTGAPAATVETAAPRGGMAGLRDAVITTTGSGDVLGVEGIADAEVVEADPTPAPAERRQEPTRAQWGKLFALLGDLGVPENDRHRYATEHLGREVESFGDLDRADVARLIDATESHLTGGAR